MIRKITIFSLVVSLLVAGSALARGGRGFRERRRDVAEMIERVNTEQDLLRVYVTYAEPNEDGTHSLVVIAVWGDLDRELDDISSEYYSNWDGVFTVTGGTVELCRRIRFDARDEREPAEGSGVDKLGEQSEVEIEWQAGVIGATDGLGFSVTVDSLDSYATLEIGGHLVEIIPTPPPAEEVEEQSINTL